MVKKEFNRIFGLDILRTVAIFLVVLQHSSFLIDEHINFLQNIILPDGVDLFFVLSGYLIGTIIINLTEKHQKFDILIALNFIQRRWFRTLPNYFLFLLINVFLVYFGLLDGYINRYLLTFFVFFQNFIKPYDFLFWESWSLSVEEWFYFFLPIILVALFKFKKIKIKPQRSLLLAIIILVTFPLVYRLIQSNESLDWDLYFRKIVLARFDTIGFGFLAAYIHRYYEKFWIRYKNTTFLLGCVLIIALLTIDSGYGFYKETFYFTFMGFSIALLLPKLQGIKNENIPFKPVEFISKISYSIYLVHLPVLSILMKISFGSNKKVLIFLSFWIFTLLISSFIYRYYEKPLMNLREKIRIGKA